MITFNSPLTNVKHVLLTMVSRDNRTVRSLLSYYETCSGNVYSSPMAFLITFPKICLYQMACHVGRLVCGLKLKYDQPDWIYLYKKSKCLIVEYGVLEG